MGRAGEVTAILDFELVRSGDPSEDLAYWSYQERDDQTLACLYDGYGGDDAVFVRAAILRLRVGLNYISYYGESGTLRGDFADHVGVSLRTDLDEVEVL
jgi:aminoglycoside phosphotransferase (APT) family kinase protein